MLLGSELQDVSVGLKHGWLCDVWFFFYKSCVDSCLDYSISSYFQIFSCRIFSSGCIGKGSCVAGERLHRMSPWLLPCIWPVLFPGVQQVYLAWYLRIESLYCEFAILDGCVWCKEMTVICGRDTAKKPIVPLSAGWLILSCFQVSRSTLPFLCRSW